MDNIESLKLDDIDLFLNEKIFNLPLVDDERVTHVLNQANTLFIDIISQLHYLYYQSLHYGFDCHCKRIHSLIKQINDSLSLFPDYKESANLSIQKLLFEIDKALTNQATADSEVNELLIYYPKKCSITQLPFTDPVTQRFSLDPEACTHTFERNAIIKYLNKCDKRTCPVAGCGKFVKSINLAKDWDVLHFMYQLDLNSLVDSNI